MIGESETQNDYDEEWENLLDSGILEDLIQKAEQENAAKRASQVVPPDPTVQSQPSTPAASILPPPQLPFNTQTSTLQSSCISTGALPITSSISSQQVPARPPFYTENVLNARPPLSQNFRKPPLPLELKDSQVQNQSKFESHVPFNSSQRPMPGPFRVGSTANGNVNPRIQISSGGFGQPKDEGRNVNELLAEKDGAISLLRSKLFQADSELYELKKISGPQNSSQQVPQLQQRELERLSLELSFKDQEVLEARRARDEKEDRLRDALDTAAALKEELESLKRLRQEEAVSNKRHHEEETEEEDAVNRAGVCRPQDVNPVAVIGISRNGNLEISGEDEKAQARVLLPDQQMWDVPWEAEKLAKIIPSGKRNVVAFKEFVSEESSDAAVLKARTQDDGCASSSSKGKKLSGGFQSSELPAREPTTDMNLRDPTIQPVRPGSSLGLKNDTTMSELTHSLQQIWNSSGARNESVSLVAEMFAVCRQDLYILLTYEGSLKDGSGGQLELKTSNVKSILGAKRKQALIDQAKKESQEGVASKLHSALANVANKLTPPTTLLGPLLEYCNCNNVNLVQSALHVLHCILRHDSFCREKVLSRDVSEDLTTIVTSKQADISESLSRLNFKQKGKGWYIPSCGLHRMDSHAVPVFYSPRLVCHFPELQKESITRTSIQEQSKEQGGTEGEEIALPHLGNDEGGANDLNPFLEWLLDMAIYSSSPGIRFEATAIMSMLVAHSEPLVERAHFGPLLWGGGLVSLLKASAGLGVQLQAVRLVHLLLHCPLLLRTFWCNQESSNGGRKCDARHDEGDIQPQWRPKVESRAVLDALASCLAYTGISLQDYALRRNSIRVLAFLATSGDQAIATIVHTQLKDAKLEKIVASKGLNKSEGGAACLPKEQPKEGLCSLLGGVGMGDMSATGKSPHSEGVDGEQVVVTGGDKPSGVSLRLIMLLADELNAEEDDDLTNGSDRAGYAEDRACLIREVLTLLYKLVSHSAHSCTLLDSLTACKETTTLVLRAMNQLITRGSRAHPGVKNPSSDLVELARGLQKRLVVQLSENQES